MITKETALTYLKRCGKFIFYIISVYVIFVLISLYSWIRYVLLDKEPFHSDWLKDIFWNFTYYKIQSQEFNGYEIILCFLIAGTVWGIFAMLKLID